MAASSNAIFAQDKTFWNNYLKGRPTAPNSLFERIYQYHQVHDGRFGTVHDVGAGNGPYSKILRSKFEHVIVSDIVEENVVLARERLGTDGFRYRTAGVEHAHDIHPKSVDMVFATNVMHFPDQEAAMNAIGSQLKPGGTFFCGTYGPALFEDKNLQDLWQRMSYIGGRELLKNADKPEDAVRIMERTQGNLCPLDPKLFLPGALRINLNVSGGNIVGVLPPEVLQRYEPNHTGSDDVVSAEDEEGWTFEMSLADVKEHILSFPFISQYLHLFTELFQELDELFLQLKVARGVFPAKIILATRR